MTPAQKNRLAEAHKKIGRRFRKNPNRANLLAYAESFGALAFVDIVGEDTPVKTLIELAKNNDLGEDVAEEAVRTFRDYEESLSPAQEKQIETGQEVTAPARFTFTQVAALETKPKAWLVRGYLEKNSLSVHFGDSETYKSFMAIALAASISAGALFYDFAVSQGPVFYIAGEGLSGIKKRFLAWALAHEVDLSTLPLFIGSTAVDMISPESHADLMKAIEAMIVEHGQPAAVFLDTLARNFGPGDENATVDMNLFVKACDLVRVRFGCAVSILHHTGHQDKSRARGGYTLKCALDHEYQIEKDDAGIVRMTCTKMKDAEHPAPLAFRPRVVELGFDGEDGRPETSVVLDSIPWTPKPQKGKRGEGKWQVIMLSVLAEITQETKAYKIGVDPGVWKDRCMAAGMPKRRFYENKALFLADGTVVSVGGLIKQAETEEDE